MPVQEIKQFGFVKPNITPDNHIFGGLGSLQKEILQPDGKWKKFLPTYEPQNIKFETSACVAFGTINVYETLLKRLTGKEYNFSERFIAILAKIRAPGSDPQQVSEVMRQYGLIKQELLPMTDTYAEYLQPDPMDKSLIDEASKFGYETRHYWLWTSTPSKQEQLRLIKDALPYSPLGISVTAWHKEGDLYVDRGLPNTHWCVLYEVSDKGYEVFDSYDHGYKTLSFDHHIEFAKGYYLATKEEIKTLSLLQQLLGLYQQLLALLKKKV